MISPVRAVLAAGLVAAAVNARAADSTLAPVWASEPVARVVKVAAPPKTDGDDPLADASWSAAEPLGPFTENAVAESDDVRTEVRLLLSGGTLYVGARCPEKDPAAIKPSADPERLYAGDEFELVLAQGPAKSFPLLHLQASPAGKVNLARVMQPSGLWAEPLVERPDPSTVALRAGIDKRGWWLVAALPLEKLGFASLPASGNFARLRSADHSAATWVEIFGGRIVNPSRFGRLVAADALATAKPVGEAGPLKPLARLTLPATLAVGVNTLDFAGAKETLVVDSPGPVAISRESGRWSADVRRPIAVSAEKPFANDPAKPLPVRLTLAVASAPAKVSLDVTQDGRSLGHKDVDAANGTQSVEIPLAGAKPGEVSIVAKVEVPLGPGRSASFEARHWCLVGEDDAKYSAFREGIEKLPLRSLWRAAAVDAATYARMMQSGEGHFVPPSKPVADEFNQGAVLLPAMLYKAEWPDVANPFKGDRRMLESAALGLDVEVDPARREMLLNSPPNRDLEGALLAYDLIKDDVPAARREFWRKGLESLVQSAVDTWVAPMTLKAAAYSDDVGTGTNHYAYHVFNVWFAGKTLGRPDWEALGRDAMRRLARHERDGQWPERRDLPAVHYSCLTLHNVALYYLLSGDDEVKDSVLRGVRFTRAMCVPTGEMFSLFDGRNNYLAPPFIGELALSLTPEGREIARPIVLKRIGPASAPRRLRGEYALYVSADAMHARDGDEKAAPQPPEFTLLDGRGVVMRRTGFVYAMSAISVPPIEGFYRLDPQNALEVWHERAGWVLKGCNSQSQPEAGSFFRKSPRGAAFLPVDGSVERTATGHAARLKFETFEAQVEASALDASTFEVRAEVDRIKPGADPVVFSFFPGAGAATRGGPGDEVAISDDELRITFRNVVIAASRPVRIERNFKLYNAYSGARDVPSKPVRAWAEMETGKPLVLRISIAEAKP